MAGRSPHEAVHNYLECLSQVISCVTKGQMSATGYRASDIPYALVLNRDEPIRLAGPARVAPYVAQNYRIVEDKSDRGPWCVTITAYEYALFDHVGHEIIVYHWHPEGESSEIVPHLHLEAGAHIGREELAKAHIPTSRVSIEAVIRLAIMDFKVKPRKQNWAKVLQETEEA